MRIVKETGVTVLYGLCAIVIGAGLILSVIALGGMLLFVPAWLIGEGYYLVGAVYTVFMWGIAWRLAE